MLLAEKYIDRPIESRQIDEVNYYLFLSLALEFIACTSVSE